MILMASEGDESSTAKEVEVLRGPHGWLNWYAERAGFPRREQSHPDSIVIRPIWEEFARSTPTCCSAGAG